MSLTNFCCCCDLRRGCIVFAWLQLMYLTMAIATMIGYADFFTTISYRYIQGDGHYVGVETAASISLAMNIAVGFLFIKCATCISLIWGVVKKCHLYYQPWLFVSGIDVCISSLSVLILFILGCILAAPFFLAFFLSAFITALNWYFWFCVYTVYKKDMKPSMISFEMEYDHYTNPPSEI